MCAADFYKSFCFQAVMKADLRISAKDYRQNKNLKTQLLHVPFAISRQLNFSANSCEAITST